MLPFHRLDEFMVVVRQLMLLWKPTFEQTQLKAQLVQHIPGQCVTLKGEKNRYHRKHYVLDEVNHRDTDVYILNYKCWCPEKKH